MTDTATVNKQLGNSDSDFEIKQTYGTAPEIRFDLNRQKLDVYLGTSLLEGSIEMPDEV